MLLRSDFFISWKLLQRTSFFILKRALEDMGIAFFHGPWVNFVATDMDDLACNSIVLVQELHQRRHQFDLGLSSHNSPQMGGVLTALRYIG